MGTTRDTVAGYSEDTSAGSSCVNPWIHAGFSNEHEASLDELIMVVAGYVGGHFDEMTYIVECPTCAAPLERHPIGGDLIDEDDWYRLELLFRDEYVPGVSTTANPLSHIGEDGVALVEVTGPCESACDIMGDPELGHPETWDCDQTF